MSLPTASIMMPAYNAGSYIADAIQCILDQTYLDWELCIVDDGSQDDTYRIALGYSILDNRIRVEQYEHQGCPQARNACIAMMSGDIYFRQDADDLCHPERIEKQVQYLLDHNHIDIVTTGMNWLKDGKILPRPSMPMHEYKYKKGLGGSPCCASVAAWSYVYDVVGGFDPRKPAGSDGHWNFRALDKNMRYGYIDEPLYTQRRHRDQISQRLSAEQRNAHFQSRKEFGGL